MARLAELHLRSSDHKDSPAARHTPPRLPLRQGPCDRVILHTMRKTFVYKLTSDRGGAPCAPPPRAGVTPLLTLSICKPAIRRTAQPGDRILGLTSRSLVLREGYPGNAVIYAAIVSDALDAREYYAPRSRFRARPDCIYEFHRSHGTLIHTGKTPLHADEAYLARDIGHYPYYKNGRTLLSHDFRYFGAAAIPIPATAWALQQMAGALGQGHRVYTGEGPEAAELDLLFNSLWSLPSRFTARYVREEAYGHAPKSRTPLGMRLQEPSCQSELRMLDD